MHINLYRALFWDFDGVIKDSVDVKTDAFVKLFKDYDADITKKIKEHHLANGGMSRFDKLPIYIQWSGQEPSEEKIQSYLKQFSQIVFQDVINSSWVPGVEAYLRENRYEQKFVLVSATPYDELKEILKALNLQSCFDLVFGSPHSKRNAISCTISDFSISASECLMIGDAKADFDAANFNKIDFLLRKHKSNISVFHDYMGLSVVDFTGL